MGRKESAVQDADGCSLYVLDTFAGNADPVLAEGDMDDEVLKAWWMATEEARLEAISILRAFDQGEGLSEQPAEHPRSHSSKAQETHRKSQRLHRS